MAAAGPSPAASAAAQAVCKTFPLFAWAAPGITPAEPPVPLATLAAYAYNHMTIPAPALTINPATKGYVNLASYVWARTRPVSAMTGRASTYEVTATLGNQTVSVWAQLAARGAVSVRRAQRERGPRIRRAAGRAVRTSGPSRAPAKFRCGHPAGLRCALAGSRGPGRGVAGRDHALVGHLGARVCW